MKKTAPAEKDTSNIRLYLLGTFRLERDARVINLPTRKVESLLAYLAFFPRQHPREKLAALLWGDSPDEQARHSLRTALGAIRKELGDDLLIADRETVQLNPDVEMQIDARKFEEATESQDAISNLQSAISNYHDLLPDFYDDWIIRERERLRLFYLDALLQLTQQYRSASNYGHAIETAQKVLASDRANEKAHQHLIFCFAAQGDRIAALKQYDECKKILREEMNAEPSSETTALRDQIMAELTGAPSHEAAMTNLPNPLTSFVGREKEIEEIKRLFAGTRLLTLTGVGGSGKTRLAVQVARETLPSFTNGVWWVELAALSDPGLVPQQVAEVLGVQESSERSLTEMLMLFIRDKSMLIALDNCEHLIAACAELVEKLLLACPNLKIIATSREALNVTGETAWRAPSLTVPDLAHLPPADELTRYDAIQLFVQRASAVEPNWKFATAGNAEAVTQICARLDGIPLAIELAAARVKNLSVTEITARLDDRFRLLTGGSRTALPRQRTLQAAIDWSYKLLSKNERLLLRRLSVFAGGWTLEAAEFVCASDTLTANDIFDLASQLVDKSLIFIETKGAETRYRFLETIRQYAQEKLDDAEESEAVHNHHLDYFLNFAEDIEPKMDGRDQSMWLNRLKAEESNLRSALEWSKLSDVNAEKGFRLASALWVFWHFHAYDEARQWLEPVLKDQRVSESVKAKALRVAASFAVNQGDLQQAEALATEGLSLFRKLGDKPGIAGLLRVLGRVAGQRNEWEQAKGFHQESLSIFRELDKKPGIATGILFMGAVATAQGDNARAVQLIEESLSLFRELDNRSGMAVALRHLGWPLRQLGDDGRAERVIREALAEHRVLNDKMQIETGLTWLVRLLLDHREFEEALPLMKEELLLAEELGDKEDFVYCFRSYGEIALHESKLERATRLFAASIALREAIHLQFWPQDQKKFDEQLSAARAELDEATFNAAWEAGSEMTVEQAIAYARENVK